MDSLLVIKQTQLLYHYTAKKKISPKVVSEITGKSVKVILDHYYGIDEDTIIEQMLGAFADTADSLIPQGLVMEERN